MKPVRLNPHRRRRSRNGGGNFPWLLVGGGVLLYMMASRPGGLTSLFRPAGTWHPAATTPTFGAALWQSGVSAIPTLFQGLSQVIGAAFKVPVVDASGIIIPDTTLPAIPDWGQQEIEQMGESSIFAASTPDWTAGWTLWDIGTEPVTIT